MVIISHNLQMYVYLEVNSVNVPAQIIKVTKSMLRKSTALIGWSQQGIH